MPDYAVPPPLFSNLRSIEGIAPKRRMAAILAADVVGYTRLIAEDEEGTLRQLAECRNVLGGFVMRHGGRIFNTAGDSVMCAFDTALDAARAAIEIQDFARAQIDAQSSGKWLPFRIGISVGEVVERRNDLLGMAVNLAARLQTLAAPGGICISRAVHEAVSTQVPAAFVDLGERRVKNIPFPVHAFMIAGRRRPTGGAPLQRPRLLLAMRALSLASLCLAILIGVGGLVSDRQLSRTPSQERSAETALPPPDSTAHVLQLTTSPVEAFLRLTQKGGQIDDPGSAPGLYHNALLFEAKGEAIAAHRAYYTLARMGLDFIDPHLRYAALVQAHEGRFIARQVYAELNEDVPTRATALVHALQFDGAERKARLEALAKGHPDFAPAYYFLAEAYSESRIGPLQTAEDKRKEHEALSVFLNAHGQDRLARFFLDQSVLNGWLDRAYRRHDQIATSPKSSIAAPMTAVEP